MALVSKNPPANARDIRDAGSIPGLARCPGGKQRNPLQSSCLENPLGRAAWWTAVHRVAKSRTQPKRLSKHTQQVLKVAAVRSRHQDGASPWKGTCALRNTQRRAGCQGCPARTYSDRDAPHYVTARVCVLSHFSSVQLSVILWTTARQVPLSMGFSRQEYWSGLPFSVPGDLPNPGITHTSLNICCIGRQVLYQ